MAASSGEWLVLRGPDEVTGWGGLEGREGSEIRLHLVVLELEALKRPLRWPGEKWERWELESQVCLGSAPAHPHDPSYTGVSSFLDAS